MKNTLLLLFLIPLLSFGQSNQGWKFENFGNTFDGDNYVAYAPDQYEDYMLSFRLGDDGDPILSFWGAKSSNENVRDAKAFLFAVDEGQVYHFFHYTIVNNQDDHVIASFPYAHLYSDKTFEESTILTISELVEMLKSGSKLEIRIMQNDINTDITFDLSGSSSALNEVINSTDNYIRESHPMVWALSGMTQLSKALIFPNQYTPLTMLIEYAGLKYVSALLFYDVVDNYNTISLVDTNGIYPELVFEKSLVKALTRLIHPTEEEYFRSVDAKEVDLIEVSKHFNFYELPNDIDDYDAILYYRVDRLNQLRKKYGNEAYSEQDWWKSDENFFKSFGIAP